MNELTAPSVSRRHQPYCAHPDSRHSGGCPIHWRDDAPPPADPWTAAPGEPPAPAEVIGTIDFHGNAIPVLENERGLWASLTALCTAMGIDTNAQRQNLARNAWSQGWTCVTHVRLPDDDRSRSHIFVHEKRIPMWLANITASRLAESVRSRVVATQIEFADVLAEYAITGKVEPRAAQAPTSVADALSKGFSAKDIALLVIEQAERADREQAGREIAEAEVRAHEGGADLTLTAFYKLYFSDVMEREFFEHMYSAGYLIDQRAKGTQRDDGSFRDGPEHRFPTRTGKRYIQLAKSRDRNGNIRLNSRVRPDRALDLKAALVADGLIPNNMDGVAE